MLCLDVFCFGGGIYTCDTLASLGHPGVWERHHRRDTRYQYEKTIHLLGTSVFLWIAVALTIQSDLYPWHVPAQTDRLSERGKLLESRCRQIIWVPSPR